MLCLFYDLNDVFIVELVVLANFLRLMFHRRTPDNSILELLHDAPVDLVTEVIHQSMVLLQDDRRSVVRKLALWFSVEANKMKVIPHLLQKIIEIPSVMGRDWNTVWNFVDDVQLLDGDLVDFVEDINARYVDSVALNYVNQLFSDSIVS